MEPGPYHIVIEDDVYRLPEWDTHWPAIRTFLESGRDDWDFITMDPVLGFDKPILKTYNESMFSVERFRATGFIMQNFCGNISRQF
jgi:hypothetical protein